MIISTANKQITHQTIHVLLPLSPQPLLAPVEKKKVSGIAVDATWSVVASNVFSSAVDDVVGVAAGDLVGVLDAEGIAYCIRGENYHNHNSKWSK